MKLKSTGNPQTFNPDDVAGSSVISDLLGYNWELDALEKAGRLEEWVKIQLVNGEYIPPSAWRRVKDINVILNSKV